MVTNRSSRCLVIEDELDIAVLIAETLRGDEHSVSVVSTGKAGVAVCRSTSPEVILLDYELPDITGRQVCEEIRKFSNAYIMVVTARSDEIDRATSLSIGADDYMVKPFSPTELKARVQALLCRPRPETTRVETVGELSIDRHARTVHCGETQTELTGLEYVVLLTLIDESPNLVSRGDLSHAAWNSSKPVDDHVIDVHISNIRKKLKTSGAERSAIQAVRSRGYRYISG